MVVMLGSGDLSRADMGSVAVLESESRARARGDADPLGIVDHLRRRFACFKLCAHLLDLGRLLFHGCCKTRNRGFQFLHLPMFFQKFVEQHRVDRPIAHTLDLSFPIPDRQIGIHLRHLFSNQAIIEALAGIDVLLETVSDWIKHVKCFASCVHRLESSL